MYYTILDYDCTDVYIWSRVYFFSRLAIEFYDIVILQYHSKPFEPVRIYSEISVSQYPIWNEHLPALVLLHIWI